MLVDLLCKMVSENSSTAIQETFMKDLEVAKTSSYQKELRLFASEGEQLEKLLEVLDIVHLQKELESAYKVMFKAKSTYRNMWDSPHELIENFLVPAQGAFEAIWQVCIE